MPVCKKCGQCCKKSPYIFESEIKVIFDFVKNDYKLSEQVKTIEDFVVFVGHDFDLTEGDKSDWTVKKQQNGYCIFYNNGCLINKVKPYKCKEHFCDKAKEI